MDNLGYQIRIGNKYEYRDTPDSIPFSCVVTNIIHDGFYVVYEFQSDHGLGATIYPAKLVPRKSV